MDLWGGGDGYPGRISFLGRDFERDIPPPPKSNIDTKNDGFLKCIILSNMAIWGIHVSFRGCNSLFFPTGNEFKKQVRIPVTEEKGKVDGKWMASVKGNCGGLTALWLFLF